MSDLPVGFKPVEDGIGPVPSIEELSKQVPQVYVASNGNRVIMYCHVKGSKITHAELFALFNQARLEDGVPVTIIKQSYEFCPWPIGENEERGTCILARLYDREEDETVDSKKFMVLRPIVVTKEWFKTEEEFNASVITFFRPKKSVDSQPAA